MAEPFSQRPFPGALASGVLMVDPGDDTCTITADFPIEYGDPIADALIASLQSKHLHFRYTLRSPRRAMLMAEVQRAIDALMSSEREGFQRHGEAFPDERSLGLALHPLAAVGSNLFWTLFGISTGNAGHYEHKDVHPSDLDAYGHCLRRWLTSTGALTIISPRNFLPWNLIYPGAGVPYQPCEVDPRGFWAFGKRLDLRDHGTCNHVPMPVSWKLAAGVESRAPAVVFGHPVHVAADHPFQRHAGRVLHEHDLDRLFGAFGDADILYFYGHARGSAHGLEYGSITLHDATMSAFNLEGMLRAGQARIADRRPLLVFLNGCLTSIGDASDGTIPGCLVRHRKNWFCFVSTITSVPAWPAAQFARAFFHAYIDAGASLGDSLSAAREEMLTQYRNPIGLFYTGSGNLATRLSER